MASLNPESDIASFVNTIFEAAILVARDNNVMSGLVLGFNDRTGLAVRQNSQYGGATINTVAETDDLTSQAFTPSSLATLTPAEAAGQYFLTDSRVESDPFAVRTDAATDLGQAMATKIETDLIGNFTSFTGGTVGAAGSSLSMGYITAAESILKANKAPYPYFLVVHPYQYQPFGKTLTVAQTASNAAPSLLEAVQNMFFVQRLGGIYVFTSANVDASGTTTTYGGLFSRSALAIDMRRAPRLEPERDASRRGWELNMSAVYGHGVWRPDFGVAMLCTGAVPTS
jgi:hypothetical protein